MSRSSTYAALLTALVMAAAGCSSTGVASGGRGGTDEEAAAAVVVQAMHGLGTGDYEDVCTIVASGSPFLADGVDGCVAMMKELIKAAGQQRGTNDFLSQASEFTVDASKVVVTGDYAVVPMDALLYQGKPVTPFDGMQDQKAIRKDGKWYVVF